MLKFLEKELAAVIITGDIIDIDGRKIGDLYDVALKAVSTWEELLKRYSVKI